MNDTITDSGNFDSPPPEGAEAETGPRPRPPSARKAVVGSIAALGMQILAILAAVLSLYLAKRYWRDEGLAFFTQWRRFSWLLVPPLLLGHGIALPRALGRAYADGKKRSELGAGSFILTAMVLLASGALMLLLPQKAGRWIMGDEKMAVISGALGVAIVGRGLGAMGMSFLRGTFRYIPAAVYNFVLTAGAPCLILLAARPLSINKVIWLISCSQLAGGAAIPAYCLLQALTRRNGLTLGILARNAAELTVYGLARMPLLVLAMVMMGFGSWRLATAASLADLGLFNSTLSLCRSFGILSAAIGFTILPLLSARMRSQDVGATRNMMSILVRATFALGLLAGTQLFLFGPSLAQIILQRFDFPAFSVQWGLIFLMLTGLLTSSILRNPLDAYSTIPYHLFCYVGGIVAMFGVWGLGSFVGLDPVLAMAICYAVSFSVMGVVSMATVKILFRMTLFGGRDLLALAGVALAAGLGCVQVLLFGGSPYLNVCFLLVNFMLVLVFFWSLRLSWFSTILYRFRLKAS